jgi:hypothetical protein
VVVDERLTLKSTPLAELPTEELLSESVYQYIVDPAETAFKFTVPDEHSPSGLAVTIGAVGPVPATTTVIGVRSDRHPVTADHDITNLPSPV